MTASIAGTGTTPAALQASRPPITPPSEAPSPTRSITRRAVYGSNSSLISDQKLETTGAPKAAMCR